MCWSLLQPPIGERRVKELGKWERKEFRVSGTSWDSSSVDVAVAGLGWFAVGLKGEAVLGVWTYDGVDLILRNSLLPHRSQNFEVAGFTVSKIVSKADQASNKSGQSQKRRKSSDPRAAAHSLPSPLTANAGWNQKKKHTFQRQLDEIKRIGFQAKKSPGGDERTSYNLSYR